MIQIDLPLPAELFRQKGAAIAQIVVPSRLTIPIARIAAPEVLEIAAPAIALDGTAIITLSESEAESFDLQKSIVWGVAYQPATDIENPNAGEYVWNAYARTVTLKVF